MDPCLDCFDLLNLLNFSGRRALVTGGGRGIGAAISRLLAAAGAEIVAGYRADEASAEATREAIRAAGGSARVVRANLVHPEEVRALVAAATEAGPLDVLVHAAALGSFKPLLETRPNQWDLTFGVNARAFLLLAQQAAPVMREDGSSMVALSSLGAGRFVPRYGAIGPSKAALEALVRSLAVELAPRRIRVNAVSAGLIENSSLRLHPDHEALVAASLGRTPAGRLGSAEDVARVVLFLASPLSTWVTGQILVADGGASLPL